MDNNLKQILMSAAFVGLVSGFTTLANAEDAAPVTAPEAGAAKDAAAPAPAKAAGPVCVEANSCKGQGGCKGQHAGEAHACKGKNGCAGNERVGMSKKACKKAKGTWKTS